MNIEDFEKQYVASVVLNEGDKILITEDNIEPLRKILKQSNFHWFIDHQGSYYDFLRDYNQKNKQAINYVFVDF